MPRGRGRSGCSTTPATAALRALIAAFAEDPALTVGDNEPYSMDSIDYTIPRHAYPGRLPYAEIEIRQDLLADEAGVADWAGRVERGLLGARAAI